MLFLLCSDGDIVGGREGWGEDSAGDGGHLLLSQSAFIQREEEEWKMHFISRLLRVFEENSFVTHSLINTVSDPFPPNLQNIITPKPLELGT